MSGGLELILQIYKEHWWIISQIRLGLKKGKEQLIETQAKKYSFFEQTAEAQAAVDKSMYELKNNAYIGDKLCDFENIDTN